jgi:hypothetical protein
MTSREDLVVGNKGKAFEREAAALTKYGKRVILSGAVGTTQGVKDLTGDAQYKLPWLRKTIAVECKHGYADNKEKKSIRIQQEWFDKHYSQCKNMKLLPIWAMKIKFSYDHSKLNKFFIVPFDVAKEIIDNEENMYIELEELRKYKKEHEKNGNSKPRI